MARISEEVARSTIKNRFKELIEVYGDIEIATEQLRLEYFINRLIDEGYSRPDATEKAKEELKEKIPKEAKLRGLNQLIINTIEESKKEYENKQQQKVEEFNKKREELFDRVSTESIPTYEELMKKTLSYYKPKDQGEIRRLVQAHEKDVIFKLIKSKVRPGIKPNREILLTQLLITAKLKKMGYNKEMLTTMVTEYFQGPKVKKKTEIDLLLEQVEKQAKALEKPKDKIDVIAEQAKVNIDELSKRKGWKLTPDEKGKRFAAEFMSLLKKSKMFSKEAIIRMGVILARDYQLTESIRAIVLEDVRKTQDIIRRMEIEVSKTNLPREKQIELFFKRAIIAYHKEVGTDKYLQGEIITNYLEKKGLTDRKYRQPAANKADEIVDQLEREERIEELRNEQKIEELKKKETEKIKIIEIFAEIDAKIPKNVSTEVKVNTFILAAIKTIEARQPIGVNEIKAMTTFIKNQYKIDPQTKLRFISEEVIKERNRRASSNRPSGNNPPPRRTPRKPQ